MDQASILRGPTSCEVRSRILLASFSLVLEELPGFGCKHLGPGLQRGHPLGSRPAMTRPPFSSLQKKGDSFGFSHRILAGLRKVTGSVAALLWVSPARHGCPWVRETPSSSQKTRPSDRPGSDLPFGWLSCLTTSAPPCGGADVPGSHRSFHERWRSSGRPPTVHFATRPSW